MEKKKAVGLILLITLLVVLIIYFPYGNEPIPYEPGGFGLKTPDDRVS